MGTAFSTATRAATRAKYDSLPAREEDVDLAPRVAVCVFYDKCDDGASSCSDDMGKRHCTQPSWPGGDSDARIRRAQSRAGGPGCRQARHSEAVGEHQHAIELKEEQDAREEDVRNRQFRGDLEGEVCTSQSILNAVQDAGVLVQIPSMPPELGYGKLRPERRS